MHVLQTQDNFRSIELHFVFIEHTMLKINELCREKRIFPSGHRCCEMESK